jgi:DNA-directed RNA polymerase sigma subunit (sigma70/sigma32)
VIHRRLGLHGEHEPETHRAIAARLGVTTAQVRAIERRALEILARAREIQALRAA